MNPETMFIEGIKQLFDLGSVVVLFFTAAYSACWGWRLAEEAIGFVFKKKKGGKR